MQNHDSKNNSEKKYPVRKMCKKKVKGYGRELTFSMLLKEKVYIAGIVATKSVLLSIVFKVLCSLPLFFAICFYIYCSIHQLRILSRSSKQWKFKLDYKKNLKSRVRF